MLVLSVLAMNRFAFGGIGPVVAVVVVAGALVLFGGPMFGRHSGSASSPT